MKQDIWISKEEVDDGFTISFKLSDRAQQAIDFCSSSRKKAEIKFEGVLYERRAIYIALSEIMNDYEKMLMSKPILNSLTITIIDAESLDKLITYLKSALAKTFCIWYEYKDKVNKATSKNIRGVSNG